MAQVCLQVFHITIGGQSAQSSGWTVKYDESLVQKLYTARQKALPNETGGAILGVTDLKTKTIVIVDVLPAPPDSEASPSHFIRGQEGQSEALEVVHKRTAGMVDYVGERHSHPDGCPARPSELDENLLSTLHRQTGGGRMKSPECIVNKQFRIRKVSKYLKIASH